MHKILHNFGLLKRVGESNNNLSKSYLICEIQMAFTNLPLATISVVYVSNQNYCPRQCQYDIGSNMFPIQYVLLLEYNYSQYVKR